MQDVIWRGWVERVNFDHDMGTETMSIEVRLDGREVAGAAIIESSHCRGFAADYVVPYTREEPKMAEYPKVTLIRQQERRLINIHVEVEENVFVTGTTGDEHVERKVGEEMPVYDTIPEEYFLPIMRAARSDPWFFDVARECFR